MKHCIIQKKNTILISLLSLFAFFILSSGVFIYNSSIANKAYGATEVGEITWVFPYCSQELGTASVSSYTHFYCKAVTDWLNANWAYGLGVGVSVGSTQGNEITIIEWLDENGVVPTILAGTGDGSAYNIGHDNCEGLQCWASGDTYTELTRESYESLIASDLKTTFSGVLPSMLLINSSTKSSQSMWTVFGTDFFFRYFATNSYPASTEEVLVGTEQKTLGTEYLSLSNSASYEIQTTEEGGYTITNVSYNRQKDGTAENEFSSQNAQNIYNSFVSQDLTLTQTFPELDAFEQCSDQYSDCYIFFNLAFITSYYVYQTGYHWNAGNAGGVVLAFHILADEYIEESSEEDITPALSEEVESPDKSEEETTPGISVGSDEILATTGAAINNGFIAYMIFGIALGATVGAYGLLGEVASKRHRH